MQADEFEKKVRNKLEELGLVPDREVWKQVSIRIEREKNKRRILIFWIFTGFVLLAGTSVYVFINNENNNKTVISEINNNSSKRENYEIKQSPKNLPQSLQKVQKIHLAKSVTHLKKAAIKQVSASERKTSDLSKIEYVKVINQKPSFINKKEDATIYQKENKYVQTSLPLHKFYNPNLSKAKTDTASAGTTGKETGFKKDSSANTTAKKLIDKKTGKKWKTGFTVYSGISDNISGLFSMNKTYSPGYLSSPGNSNNGNYNNGNYNYQENLSNSFKSAFSSGFGFFVKNQLTKRISFSAGVDYHFYSAKSMVGKSVSSPTAFYDSESQTNIVSERYYIIGNSVKYSNKYQLLELPINILLQLNKNAKKPLLLSAGISPGYLIASNALYANPSANVYYTDKEKFHRFQLSAQGNLLFPVSNSGKFFLHAGPVIQYGLTNAAKTVTGGRQHLLFTGIKASITFK